MRMKTKGIVYGLVSTIVLMVSVIKMEFVFNFFFGLFWSSMEGAEVFAALPVIAIWYGFWAILAFRFLGGVLIIIVSRFYHKLKGGN